MAADTQLQQLTLSYLFGAVYVYLDWYYDNTPMKGAKLVIALFATVPALVSIVQLLRMGWYALFFLLNRTVDALTLGTVMPLYSHYQDKCGELKDYGADNIGLQDLWALPLPDEGKMWSNFKYFVLHYCAGSWDGQCQVIRTPVHGIGDWIMEQQDFGRREYLRITDELHRDFEETRIEGKWHVKKSEDLMSSTKNPNDPASIRSYCLYIVLGTELPNSYTLVKNGGFFYLPVLKRNDPNRLEHQYATVFCISQALRPHHLHLPREGRRRWIVRENCDCDSSDQYDTHFYNLTLLSDHNGHYLNVTRLII